ncbi:MAG: hypothetical protein WCG81_00765 [Candidatus Angelobacter sp.]
MKKATVKVAQMFVVFVAPALLPVGFQLWIFNLYMSGVEKWMQLK